MTQRFANAARGVLASTITSGTTTIEITQGGDLFPVISGNDWFKAVLQGADGIEIIRVNARTGNVFTVVRGQEGTTARAFSVGAVVGLRITAADMEGSIATANNSVQLTGNQTIGGIKTFSSQIVASGGVQGNITGNAATVTNGVYTTSTQTLTNKTIAFGSNTLTDVASTNTAQTLTNKTLTSPAITGGTASGLTLNDGYTEEIFNVTGTTPALSPTNGSIQTWTLTGNSTPTAGTWAAGQSMTLMVNDGTAFTITWTSLGVVWAGGTAPTLATSGFTVLHLWMVGSTTYGIRAGEVA